jgi:hypothetical protein
MWSFMGSMWPRLFMVTVTVQALICIAGEAYIFTKFSTSVNDDVTHTHNDDTSSQYKIIPTFLTLFIFGFLYQVVLAWDALRMKNTIQIIGLCISNLAMMIFAAIQIDQIREALMVLGAANALLQDRQQDAIWGDIGGFLIAIPIIVAACFVVMCFITWKLYQEFAWDILKTIGADYRMKKRFLHYQIYIALLKFDFFFFLGFTVQFIVIVVDKVDPEFGFTIAAIPITIAILLLAAFFTRRENKPGMVVVIIIYLIALSYFIFKLVRIYQPGYQELYRAIRRSMTAFAVVTILLILLTITNAIVCTRNFGAGLKAHIVSLSRKQDEEKQDAHSVSLHDVKPQMPSRMTID